MYIAFKWLLCLSLLMWLSMCFIDVYIEINKENVNTVIDNVKQFESKFKNFTLPLEQNLEYIKEKNKYSGMVILHGAMFFAGALAVTIFNRKRDIIYYLKIKFSELNVRAITKKMLLQETARRMDIAIVKYVRQFWEITCKYMINLKILYLASKKLEINRIKHAALLKKLKDIDEERRNLGQLLITAIHENKNVRMQYQLETMAKSRLLRHMEVTHRQIKDNRSRYISFQQLYFITHQENAYLKARVRKLITEKNEAENNLMILMNEVHKMKSKELKAFCSRFIVKTKNNLLNSDVGAEIQKFLQKSDDIKACCSNWHLSRHHSFVVDDTYNWPTCTEITQEDSIVPLVSEAPKLKGLPGEYVWTVKDKNGIIEKLYQYDYEPDYDNGDTIRRIRQYSVYYDKDCLLDFSNSKTTMHGNNINSNRNFILKNHRFLTGSEAFQQFLKYSGNIVTFSSLMPQAQRLYCE